MGEMEDCRLCTTTNNAFVAFGFARSEYSRTFHSNIWFIFMGLFSKTKEYVNSDQTNTGCLPSSVG